LADFLTEITAEVKERSLYVQFGVLPKKPFLGVLLNEFY